MSKGKRKFKKRKSKTPEKNASNPLEFELPWKETWIAVNFQRHRQREPNYSFKEFILENGVHLAECYERFQRKLILWHGTTLPRAKSILREGFHRPKGIWMTENAQHRVISSQTVEGTASYFDKYHRPERLQETRRLLSGISRRLCISAASSTGCRAVFTHSQWIGICWEKVGQDPILASQICQIRNLGYC